MPSTACRSAISAIRASSRPGRLQTSPAPGGSITVYLDARDLNGGIIALAEKFAPALADPLRRLAARQKTATLRAAVSLDGSGATATTGKVELTGQLGAVKANLTASATGKREAFSLADLGALAGTNVRIDSQLEADDSGPLLTLLGLDRMIAAEPRPAKLTFAASGRSAATCGSRASSTPVRSMRAARA